MTYAVGVFGSQSHEVKKLAYIARIMTARSDNGVVYEVGDTYFDFGHDWKWTTILAYRSPNSHWQALYPTDQRKIFNAETREELDRIVQELMDEKQKAYPSLYSFRKTKRVWNINVTHEVCTSFTVEAEDAEEAQEIFEQWAWENGDRIKEKLAEEYSEFEFSYPDLANGKADITKEDI